MDIGSQCMVVVILHKIMAMAMATLDMEVEALEEWDMVVDIIWDLVVDIVAVVDIMAVDIMAIIEKSICLTLQYLYAFISLIFCGDRYNSFVSI
jgi:hypothetical protein